MKIFTNKFASKAKQFYIGIVLVGCVLSAMVYYQAETIKRTSSTLMEQQIPALRDIRLIETYLVKQERLLYEYYATSKRELYLIDFLENHVRILALIKNLDQNHSTLALESSLSDEFKSGLDLALKLHENLSSSSTSWDLAREQLEQLTELQAQVMGHLTNAETIISNAVDSGYKDTESNLHTTVNIVFLFTFAIVLVSIYTGRYASKFIKLSARNERLALFPTRNPNPIVSLSANLELNYCNPAAIAMHKAYVSDKHSTPIALLSPNIKQQLIDTKQSASHVERFYTQLDNHYLTYQIHWLQEIDAFDIHIRDVTEQFEAERSLEYLAFHHPYSKLPNQASLETYTNELISLEQPFSLMLIDVSHFKLLLEQYGLSGANECINAFAMHLSRSANKFSQQLKSKNKLTFYHIADANFVVIYTEQDCSTTLDDLLKGVQSRLSQAISTPYGEMRMSFNCGVTRYPTSNDYKTLLLHANIALEEAVKRHIPYAYFDTESGVKHAQQLHIARRLDTAIEKQQFELYFQPKMHLKSQTINSCECLIRWFDDGKFVSPAQFIPIAEHSGFILSLGEWILDSAFAQAKKWHQQNLNIRLAINISARQFTQQDFVQSIKQRLAHFNVPAHLIELEITETAIMDDEEFGISVLQALSALGISLSIDDFGTGYSSLGYLQRFPVNKLKIDQSFVRNMATDTRDQALVLSICQLAKNLGLDIIAEGVEEYAQLEKLKEYNCDLIQGYLLSRPIPANEFEAFLAKGVSF